MRRTPLPVVRALAAGLLLAGCGSFVGGGPGAERTQDRSVDAVSAVELATSGDLILTTGKAPALRITAGQNVIDHLTSEVRDDRLTLGADRSLGDEGTIRYELVLPAARRLEVSGSGGARAASPSAVGEVVLSGSGDVRIEGLTTQEFGVDVSGSGNVTVDGRATSQHVELDGSGQYDARQLDSEDAEVTVAGSGGADVQVTGHLNANVSGSGPITYAGGATVDRQVDGSGSIEER
jgi:hypothetical protein